MSPYEYDELTVEKDPILQRQLADTGLTLGQELYRKLCDQHGMFLVEYTQRCFYLKAYKKVVGRYPCKLDYLRIKALIGIEEEVLLKKSAQMYDMNQERQQHHQEIERQRIKGTNIGSGSGGMRRLPANSGFRPTNTF